MPVRGALALVTTVLAVILLFSFRPADPTTALNGGALPTLPPLIGAPISSSAPLPTLSTPPPQQVQQTSPPDVAGPPAPSRNPGNGGTGRTGSSATPTPAPTVAPGGGNGNGSSGTFTGRAVQTPYGTVQIALIVQNGRIVDVQELQLPNDRRLSQQISAEAGPMLRDEVIQAQSDKIDGVSGASYTSYGFYLSLQSALQQM